MSERVLCVDDDQNVLAGYQRALRSHVRIDTAPDGATGLLMLEADDYAVVVSDLTMPGMNGIQFLQRAREAAPDTVRMMLTGNADVHTAVDALNQGQIFQFLLKPCPADNLKSALDHGIRQHKLVTAERDLLEKTLRGSIKVLVDILSTVDPDSFGRAQQLRANMQVLADVLKAPDRWKLELTAMLSQIGMVTIPGIVMQKARNGVKLTDVEQAMLDRMPQLSHGLLINIPRLSAVAQNILYQTKNFDGTGTPNDAVTGLAIPFGARMLRILQDIGKLEARGLSKTGALATMCRQSEHYDPEILAAASLCFAQTRASLPTHRGNVRRISADRLRVGNVLASDVQTDDGTLLIQAGHRVSETLLERLRNFQQLCGISQDVYVEAEDEVEETSVEHHRRTAFLKKVSQAN